MNKNYDAGGGNRKKSGDITLYHTFWSFIIYKKRRLNCNFFLNMLIIKIFV